MEGGGLGGIGMFGVTSGGHVFVGAGVVTFIFVSGASLIVHLFSCICSSV